MSLPCFHSLLLSRLRSFRHARASRTLVLAGSALALGAASEGSGASVNAYKQLSLAQLMEIEVTSVSRRPEALAQVASAVQIVTGDEVHRAGATSIPEALRLLANLQVAQIDSRQWAITARGFNNTLANKLLVQLDGRILYTPLYAGVFWDAQHTFLPDLDRIEAISGPGATQWGSNAVNGVINLTTKPARDTQGGLVHASVGTELRSAGAVRYGGSPAPGVFYRVYAQHAHRGDSITAAGQNPRDAWRNLQGGFRVDWDRNTDDRLTLQGDTYQGRFDQAVLPDIETAGANLLGRWTRTLGPGSELAVQAYYDYIHREIPGSITEHLYIYDLDVQHRTPLGPAHTLVWGANYRLMDDRIKNPPTLAFLPAHVKREWISGFVQDELSLAGDRLKLTGGIKVERNPYSGTEAQPSLRAGWRWRHRQFVWAAVSRALRTPSRIDREFFTPGAAPFSLAGGPSFHSTKLLAYELGYRAEPRADLALSVSTFFHDYDDLRSLEFALTPGQPATFGNGIEAKSYGAELSADYRPASWWRLKLGYTEQRVSLRAKPGSRDRTVIGSQAFDPKRHGLLRSQFELGPTTAIDVIARYVGRTSGHRVPAYTELDLRLSWRPTAALEVAFSGRNLLDDQHPEFGPPLPTLREIERSFSASVTWRF